MHYNLIIFDLDGTLVDSKHDLANTVNATLRKLGEPTIQTESVHSFVGHGVRVLMQKSLRPGSQHLLEEGMAIFLDLYRNHLLDQTRPYPGIEPLLADLAALGCSMALLTNKPIEMSRRILNGLGIMHFFLEVVGADSLPTRKPDPAGVFYLCRKAQMARSRSLMVGDSEVDIATGRAAGITTCGVNWGFGSPGLLACSPDYLIHEPWELKQVVAGLAQK